MSECDYIRKMLNKNHMDKVPSKAANRLKMNGPYLSVLSQNQEVANDDFNNLIMYGISI